MTALLVVLGAAAGAACRWAVDRAVRSRVDGAFPWGTLVVNVAGSLLLGVLLGAAANAAAGPGLLALVGTGFAGAFTTYSTFAYDTVRLAEEGLPAASVGNVVASLVLGLLATLGGWAAGVAVWA